MRRGPAAAKHGLEHYAVTYSAVNLIFGAPYGLQIGVVAGLLEFIPYLGGLVGMVLSVTAAATVSQTTALLVRALQAVIGAGCLYFVAPFAFAKAPNSMSKASAWPAARPGAIASPSTRQCAARWTHWMHELQLNVETLAGAPVLTLSGTLRDQAALLGVLNQLSALGLPLISVELLHTP